LPLIYPFAELAESTAATLPRQVANAQAIFNVLSSVVIIPFTGQFAALVKKIVPDM